MSRSNPSVPSRHSFIQEINIEALQLTNQHLKERLELMEKENQRLKQSLFLLSNKYEKLSKSLPSLSPFAVNTLLNPSSSSSSTSTTSSPSILQQQKAFSVQISGGGDDLSSSSSRLSELFTSPSSVLPTFLPRKPLKGHTGAIYSVDFSPCGSFVASSSFDRTIRIWAIHRRSKDEVIAPPSHPSLPSPSLSVPLPPTAPPPSLS